MDIKVKIEADERLLAALEAIERVLTVGQAERPAGGQAASIKAAPKKAEATAKVEPADTEVATDTHEQSEDNSNDAKAVIDFKQIDDLAHAMVKSHMSKQLRAILVKNGLERISMLEDQPDKYDQVLADMQEAKAKMEGTKNAGDRS